MVVVTLADLDHEVETLENVLMTLPRVHYDGEGDSLTLHTDRQEDGGTEGQRVVVMQFFLRYRLNFS